MINGRNQLADKENSPSVGQTTCNDEQMMPADMVTASTTRMTNATSANGLPSGGNKNNVRARECNDESEPSEITSGPRTNAEATKKMSNGGECNWQQCSDVGPGAGYLSRRHR